MVGNLKSSLSGTFPAFNYDKYARRYLGGYCFHFNIRFSLAVMAERIANAVCCGLPCTEQGLTDAEPYGYSRSFWHALEDLGQFLRPQRWRIPPPPVGLVLPDLHSLRI